MTELHLPYPTARGVEAIPGGLDDSVYNRLLKERIIVLGSEVTDQVANRICAQLLLLAAEDPDRDINLWIKDRKSTRLNSSHSSISYAVFCLKKKKDKK